MTGYRKRQGYKRKPKSLDGKKVDVHISRDIINLYEEFGNSGTPMKKYLPGGYFDEKLGKYEGSIKDEKVGELAICLFDGINDFCQNRIGLACIEAAVREFEKILLDEIGIKYDINLVVDGNL